MVTKGGTAVVFTVRHFPSHKRGDDSVRLVQTLKSAAFSHNEKKCRDKASAAATAAFSIPSPQLASWETRASGFSLFHLCCSAAFTAKRSLTSHSDFLPS